MAPTHTTIKVVIADSQFLVTETLKSLLLAHQQYLLAGQAEDRQTLRRLLRDHEVDVLITDCTTFEYQGATTLAQLVVEYPAMSIVVLTNQLTKNEITELNKIGIKNMLFKTADRDELLSALDAATRQKKYYSDEVLDLLMTHKAEKPLGEEQENLTPSEIGIVKLIAGGLTTKEIAGRKNISFHTVMSHRKNIFRKLGINNASELVMQAVRNGWIDPIEYYI